MENLSCWTFLNLKLRINWESKLENLSLKTYEREIWRPWTCGDFAAIIECNDTLQCNDMQSLNAKSRLNDLSDELGDHWTRKVRHQLLVHSFIDQSSPLMRWTDASIIAVLRQYPTSSLRVIVDLRIYKYSVLITLHTYHRMGLCSCSLLKTTRYSTHKDK